MRTAIVLSVMALAAYVAGAAPGWSQRAAASGGTTATAAPMQPTPPSVYPATPPPSGPSSYARAVDAAMPCVVTIIPEIHISGGEVPAALADRIAAAPGDDTVCKGIGSGVIMRGDGYILTNNHVVEFADKIGVQLPGRDETVAARVIGVDAETDLAVLKIELDRTLPAIGRADSDRLAVGDVVLALGNPFGIGPTVSLGIVSATGRGMGSADLEDYVQTDAPINLGCSGGALVDAHGRLVGINTAIFSPRGTNIGIGFAISSNLALAIGERLIADGRIDRVRLGVVVRAPTREEAQARSLDHAFGSHVERVDLDTPAALAGVLAGDLVLAVDGIAVRSPQHLQLLVAIHRPGDGVELSLLRAGEPLRLRAELVSPPPPPLLGSGDAAGEGEGRMRAVKTAFPL
ncbi:MAG: trypsin-like peptidase domain-containing protein [Planctomycetes bacterium]|nr:trypsin-like peptidase domain-containing protein [Planctomycetota bacterium]